MNKRQDARFAMERHVYARLPKSWPITLVEAFRTAIGPCIVTTAYVDTGWASYRPSDASDRAVARSPMAQFDTIHRLGARRPRGRTPARNSPRAAPKKRAQISIGTSEGRLKIK